MGLISKRILNGVMDFERYLLSPEIVIESHESLSPEVSEGALQSESTKKRSLEDIERGPGGCLCR